MNATAGAPPQITQLASPVKVGKGKAARYGMLIANGNRLQLITGRGVELDVDRRELVDAKAADSMPRITFTTRGAGHRLLLVAGRPGHDSSGLVAGLKGQPHYAQQASAVPRWNDWLHPRTPEQLAQLERHRQATERGQRFESEEIAEPGRLQTPVWHAQSGALAQLQMVGDELFLASTDGAVLRLGPAYQVGVSWSGSGRKATLHLRSSVGGFAFCFRPPKQKGGGSFSGSGTDADAVIIIAALPVLAFFSVAERRKARKRIRRWKDALPGATAAS